MSSYTTSYTNCVLVEVFAAASCLTGAWNLHLLDGEFIVVSQFLATFDPKQMKHSINFHECITTI